MRQFSASRICLDNNDNKIGLKSRGHSDAFDYFKQPSPFFSIRHAPAASKSSHNQEKFEGEVNRGDDFVKIMKDVVALSVEPVKS